MNDSDPRMFCLVTIHGIGFQQAPENGTPGYADRLHERLSTYLDASILSDDPGRQRERRGENGPIYVQSAWPPSSNDIESGLKRLGSWRSRSDRQIDISGAPLGDGSGRVAHIALVYSHLEEQGAHLGSGFLASTMAAGSLGHYASVVGLTRMALLDTWTMLAHHGADEPPSPSLRVRDDAPAARPLGSRIAPSLAARTQDPGGLLATVRQLEADVATYVCRNDLRERVRSFVREALMRLLSRPDVESVVVNAHSNGTVAAFDVLRELPVFMEAGVQALVTAGSPLRKYAGLFNWGNEAGSVRAIPSWINFWDGKDPVADPLAPPPDWRPGQPPVPTAGGGSLYEAIDPNGGALLPIRIEDREVDNIANSHGGGLRAHNYWDNEPQFVQPLADMLRRGVSQPPSP